MKKRSFIFLLLLPILLSSPLFSAEGFAEPYLEKIKAALRSDNFYTMTENNGTVICLPSPSNNLSFQDQKDFIFQTLKKHYAGYSEIKKNGFSKKIWNQASTFEDLCSIFDDYLCDNHFAITINGQTVYRRAQQFDEGSVKSSDPNYTFATAETSNCYYIRYTSCSRQWDDYKLFPSLATPASQKANIILDFRTNGGGSNFEQIQFFNNLIAKKYAGTVYILQDNWSYSSGEVWEIASRYSKKLKLCLVGTHSGGMQRYGNIKNFSKGNVTVYVATKSFTSNLPENYLGEGRGYEPQIWAHTRDMKTVLEGLGLDLHQIEFK